ncbi:MAG: YicC family protein [Cytophagales bacterium]|nr:YicC family protein [Cytophagales bacterium]
MTGFGHASFENEAYSISAEVKSLNSKFLDASIRLPKAFVHKDIVLRNLLNQTLERGKVQVAVDFQVKHADELRSFINRDLFLAYYEQLRLLAHEVGASEQELFKLALQSPDVITSDMDAANLEQEWTLIEQVVQQAIAKCADYRRDEGENLKVKILENVDEISRQLSEVEKLEAERLENVKLRLRQNLKELMDKDSFDPNRFEQELIYYIEKLDINEEKIRLRTHLAYFKEVAQSPSAGKKLGFIAQEIGREVNTIGSKANHAGIQKLVVNMKEELEKIKEQTLNIL